MKPVVVILNDAAHVNGGAAKVALQSAVGLARRGHRVILFSAVGPVALPSAETLPEGLEVHCLEQPDILNDPNRGRAFLRGLWNLSAARALDEVLRGCDREKTVIHVHSWTKALSSSVVRRAIRNGFQVLLTLHDYFSACPNGGFYNYQRGQSCDCPPLSVRCLVENCDSRSYSHKLWRAARQVVQNRAGLLPRRTQNFLAISEFSKAILRPYLPENSTIFSLCNPIDVVRQERVAVERNRALVMVGRLAKEKGCGLFAAAVDALGLEGVLVGEGPCRNEIEAKHPSLEITGWVGADRVAQNLRRARALVFPSLLYEVQPLALLEAAALGIPAIVPDRSAAMELVEDGETGLVFKSGDGEDLADKIRLISESPEFAADLGAAAYARYWANPPTLEKHLDGLQEIYEQICHRGVSAPGGWFGRG